MAASESARERKVAEIERALGEQVVHRDLGEGDRFAVFLGDLLLEALARRAQHVDVHVRDGAEAAPLHQDRPLAQHLGRLQHLPLRREHRGPGESELHEPQAHHTIVHVAELDAGELDHVDFDAVGAQTIEQRFDQLIGIVEEEEGTVEQVHTDHPERFLLQRGLLVEHAHMDHDLAVVVARVRLELHAHPAVALVVALEAASHHRVGEGEEGGVVPSPVTQPREIQLVFVVEHRLQAFLADVARGVAVDGVTDLHVVRRDALRDRTGRAADAEEPAHHFLARADLGEGSIAAGVEIDSQCLLSRIFRSLSLHARAPSGGARRPRNGASASLSRRSSGRRG